MREEDWPDQIEHDPRWEVPPRLVDEEDAGGIGRVLVVASVVMAAFVAVLTWMVLSTPPAL